MDVLALYDYHYKENEMELVGKGGFGRVFRVFNKLDDRFYAIKKIPMTEKNIKGALHEIRILASIVHPHVIRYYHSWIESSGLDRLVRKDEEEAEEVEEEVDIVAYFFNIQMEYCEGSLRDYLWKRREVDLEVCYDMMSQILDGLRFLHTNGVIHRDVKPDNILLYKRNPLMVKISDFGLAKAFHKKLTMTESSTYAGSFLYASPEQYSGESYSFSTDIYSLGIMLLEIQKIFTTDMERILLLREVRESRVLPTDVRYGDLILRMTSKHPSDRPSVVQLQIIFFNAIHHPSLLCRDILWEVIYNALTIR